MYLSVGAKDGNGSEGHEGQLCLICRAASSSRAVHTVLVRCHGKPEDAGWAEPSRTPKDSAPPSRAYLCQSGRHGVKEALCIPITCWALNCVGEIMDLHAVMERFPPQFGGRGAALASLKSCNGAARKFSSFQGQRQGLKKRRDCPTTGCADVRVPISSQPSPTSLVLARFSYASSKCVPSKPLYSRCENLACNQGLILLLARLAL
jgi:hypothetical protein